MKRSVKPITMLRRLAGFAWPNPPTKLVRRNWTRCSADEILIPLV